MSYFFCFITGLSLTTARIARNFQGLPGNYCWTDDNLPLCCSSRQDDSCKRTVRDITCYCDNFCFERAWYPDDCCPDFFNVCHGIRSVSKTINGSFSPPDFAIDFYQKSDVSHTKEKPILPYVTEHHSNPVLKSNEEAIKLQKKTIEPDKIISSLKLSGFSRTPCTSNASCVIGSSCMKGCNICLSSSVDDSNFSSRMQNGTSRCKKMDCTGDCQRTRNYLRKNREYRLSMNEHDIRQEIMQNGPVQAVMRIYPDFFLFHKGVYQTVFNTSDHKNKFKFHAVRIIGWGVIKGLKYWIVANSWGKSWGNRGYFRIVRGKNECDIEKYLIAC